jgi:hypothetical protein
MYVNGKMRPVEPILRIRGGVIKDSDVGGKFNLIYCKNFYKCHNVSPALINLVLRICHSRLY